MHTRLLHATAFLALDLCIPNLTAGFTYEDDFSSDPALNPGLVSLPGGQDPYLGYDAGAEDLYFQCHDLTAAGGSHQGGGYLQLVGARFKAGRDYTMTVEAAQWRGTYDTGLAFEAGFSADPPAAINHPLHRSLSRFPHRTWKTLQITYRRRIDDPSLHYTPMFSTNLAMWVSPLLREPKMLWRPLLPSRSDGSVAGQT